jgi:hypothetical protein
MGLQRAFFAQTKLDLDFFAEVSYFLKRSGLPILAR